MPARCASAAASMRSSSAASSAERAGARVLPRLVRIARTAEREGDPGLPQRPGDDDLGDRWRRAPRRSGAISLGEGGDLPAVLDAEARVVDALVVALERRAPVRSCRSAGPAPATSSSASRRRGAGRAAAASASMSRWTMLYCSWIASSAAGRDIGLRGRRR